MSDEKNSVRKSVTVAAAREVAFRVFTERMSSWWPLATHHIAKVEAKECVVEPRAGGRWFERGIDGSECEWGSVLVWEPPARVVLGWQLDADWKFDPKLVLEVEVNFIAESPTRTRVELEHRNLDLYGAKRAEATKGLEGPGGWQALLDAFAKAAV